MSMPLIEKIDQISYYGPCIWNMRTSKGKIVYAKYDRGTLTCRYDNQFNGLQFFMKKFAGQHTPRTLSTEEMLLSTKFKLDHGQFITTEKAVG